MDLAVSKKERVYLIVAIILLILFIVFILLNAEPTTIDFIIMKVNCPISLALAMSFFIGIVAGAVGNVFYKKQKKE